LSFRTLEDRTVPTAYSWTEAVSGNFNDLSKPTNAKLSKLGVHALTIVDDNP
jgi:hypothetical protein